MGRYDLANEFAAAKEEHDRIRRDREAKEKKEKDAEIAQLREALIFYRDQLGQLSKLPPGMPPLDKATLILVMLADLLIDAGKRAQEALGDDRA